ncbi:nucleotide kinase domain-containing protein [Nostoc sp. WHI]|uniref:nucleotide kinase domain-containing protein n=1 Tax=Nostoc sp. WHI TaxID=2650611 RepID=UPI0018C83D42|nr:nucleotide kinase domain-containing protein [Nostoc sp. WHI]
MRQLSHNLGSWIKNSFETDDDKPGEQCMQVRQEIFDAYWRFATMRQEVFFNKINNVPRPWTSDPIINTYKFCNAYRASDRVSQYLIKNVIYDENRSKNEEEVILRILLFKIFNKIETWEYLENKIGDYITLSNFESNTYSNILEEAMNLGYVIYTSAYMSCASKEFGYDKKHQNHLALIDKMVVQDRVVNSIVKAKNFEDVFQIIQEYPLLGKFMAYQLATDINYSEIINFDENSFTIAGPGAERGISKCFLNTDGKTYTDIIHWMTENQEKEFQRLGLNFQSLWGHPLQAIDCQNLFCETDKYCRAAFPDLKSNRKKIKSKFTLTPQPIDYFYPPKWGINDKVKQTLAQRLPQLDIPNLQEINARNYQQLSLELDSQVKTTSEVANNVSKQYKKSEQETQRKKSKILQNPEMEKHEQLCLF